MLAFVVGQLDGRNPFIVKHRLGQLDHHVERLDADIISEMRSDAEARLDTTVELLLERNRLLGIETVGKKQ